MRFDFRTEYPRQADIDCTYKTDIQNTLSAYLKIKRRPVSSDCDNCPESPVTGMSGSFAITCRSLAERVIYRKGACFLLRSPPVDRPFGRSLRYVIVRL